MLHMAGNRSPNYPAVGLPEAIEIAQKLYKSEKRSLVTPGDAARAMGYNALHGPARSRISALRKFGLLDDAPGGLRLSEAALTILFPPSEEERQAVLRDAAVRPELFRELASQDPGASDGNLVGRLVRMGFTAAGAKAAVASYRSTMSLARSEDEAYDPPEEEDQDVLDSTLSNPPFRQPLPPKGGQSFVFPLPNGAQVQLFVSGGTLTKQGVDMLKKYLDLAKEAVPNAEAQSPASPVPASPTESEPPAEQSPDAAQG